MWFVVDVVCRLSMEFLGPALGGLSPLMDGSCPIEEPRGLGRVQRSLVDCDRCGQGCDSVVDDRLMTTCCVSREAARSGLARPLSSGAQLRT